MTNSLEDIIPESLVPAGYKQEYNALKKVIAGGVASKRVKEAIIGDMEDILNAISRDYIKKERLEKFRNMVHNIQETNKSPAYKQQIQSPGGEDLDRDRMGTKHSLSSE